MQKDGEIRWQNVYFVIFFVIFAVFLQVLRLPLQSYENPMNFSLKYKISTDTNDFFLFATIHKENFLYAALFFLICNGALWTLTCSSVCLCLLSTNRKTFSVTDSTIASDLLKSLDVESDLSS